MKNPHQKLKLLYLMKILLEETDEQHPMSRTQITQRLEKQYGITCDRKTFSDDLECLSNFGLDICSEKTRTTGYFIGNRDFELPELKLLVDVVQSSKFITEEKSRELIKKLEGLTSRHNANILQGQVVITNRVKTHNKKIYYNVDKIHEAIAAGRQITFKYFSLDINKNRIYREGKEKGSVKIYKESPVALTWDDENYYLITYKKKYDKYVHYRVDKMEDIHITEEERILSDKPFDLSEYAKSMFQMFGGEAQDVYVRFDNELVGVVYDRFGMDVHIQKENESCFKCRVRVAVSPQFLSWIASFGKKAKIIAPDNVVEQMRKLLAEAAANYSEDT